ncbi:MAG: hypothetical protein QNJ15_11070 [Erythrobacter sp.]|nr:hypothetical protein [Erythrobacter sp.]
MPDALDGVGMIRGEYIFRKARSYVLTDEGKLALDEYLSEVLRAYPDRPIWYRFAELDVEEVKVLKGGDGLDLNDRILSMGNRGVRRSMLFPEAFREEIAVVAAVAAGHSRFGVIVPFVADVPELEWALGEISTGGWGGKVGVMAEIPAAVVTLAEMLERGLSRVLLGMNDLTQFTMAAFRGSNRYPGLPLAMRRMIEMAREATATRGAELALAGGLNQAHLDAADEIGADACVVHYSDLPRLLGESYASLPDLSQLAAIKSWTRAEIAKRREAAAELPLDPYGN